MKLSKKITIAEYELPIEVIKDGNYFLAKCPKWSDCYAQGETLEEVINEISYVASSLIEIYKEEGLNIPHKLKKIKRQNKAVMRFNFPLVVSSV
jgi:predicted RNase H-like HicB family nuclease